MSNDVAIIQRILIGDQKAFAALVRQYQGAVFGLAYHYVEDFQDAQEIVQDVFLKVYHRLSTLDDPLRFPKWLRRIAYTESMMRLRARSRRVATHPFDAESSEVMSRDIQQYKDAQRRDAIVEALTDLPEESRLLIELRYLGGYTSQEIAGLLEMKPGTVRYRLHRAIRSLKEEFDMVEEQLRSQQLPKEFADGVLQSLGRLKGRVIGVDGEPLGSIQLQLDQLVGEGGMYSSKGIHVDPDGTFSLDIPNWSRHRQNDVDTGEFHVGLYGMVSGAVRHADMSVTLKIGEQARDIVLDLQDKPYPLRVRVVDRNGQPVEGARVALHLCYSPGGGGHGFDDTYDGKNMLWFLTDAEGLTPMLHLSEFEYLFGVTADGFKTFDLPGKSMKVPDNLPEDGIVEIQLEPGGRIAGCVADSKGTPVSNAKIALRSHKSDERSWKVGRYINLWYTADDDVCTDTEGRFVFTTLEAAGAYCLHAYCEGYGVDCLLDVPVGTEDAVLQLMPVVSLCGTLVKDSRTVAILEEDFDYALDNKIAIEFVESQGGYANFNDGRLSPYRMCNIHIFTDDSGVFRVDYLFPGATYKLTIPFEGREHVHTVTLGEDPETHMAFELE